MGRVLLLFLLFAGSLFGANFRLYLKDGTYHLVREYKVDGERVRYYSVERGDWEEIPVDLLDLKRTESENSAKEEKLKEDSKMIAEEDAARREAQREILKIPRDPGAYMLENNQLRVFQVAESKVHSDKKRTVLKVLSPLPFVSGKATVELDNPHSKNVIDNSKPEIFLQLSDDERYGVIKLFPKGEVRIADKVEIVPITKEIIDDIAEVAVFRKQLTDNYLFKIWPEQPLEDGEYAVIQFTPGKMNMQIWDFAVKAAK